MSRPLRVLGYSKTSSTLKQLEKQLSALPWLVWLGEEKVLSQLNSNLQEHHADVVLLDWQGDTEGKLNWLKEHTLTADCPYVVFILHNNVAPEQLMQAVRFGAREILDYPEEPLLESSLLELALLRLYNLLNKAATHQKKHNEAEVDLPPEAFRRPSRLISVFSAKGGAGTSSVAVNLAYELRQLTRQEVLLFDLDQLFNNTALMLNLKPSHALGDLANRSPKELDDTTLQKITLEHESGLHLLAASKSILDDNPMLSPELLGRVMQFSRNYYAYIIVDLPSHSLDPYHQFFVEQAEDVLVVSGLDVPGLVRTRQYLDLANQFVPEGKLKLILNRWDLEAAYGMTNKSLEEEFRFPVYGRLANDWELNVEANSLGKVYSKVNPKAQLVKDVQALATKLAGLDSEALEEESLNDKKTLTTGSRRLGGLFNQLFGIKS